MPPAYPALLSAVLLAAVSSGPIHAQAPPESASEPLLMTFVQDATTFTALPWQQERLGLSPAQVRTIRGIAAGHQATIEELYAEVRMLFENVGRLDRPVDAHEAFALYYDIAAHKAEALATFHTAAEAMRDVLTPTQRAQWDAELADAGQEQRGP